MYNVQNYELQDTNTRLHDYKIQITRAVVKSELIHVTLFTNIYKITNYNFFLLLANETWVLYCYSLTISCTGFPTFANASAGRHEKLRNINLTMIFTFVYFLSISSWTFPLIYKYLVSTLWGMKPRILSNTLSGRV